MRKMYITLKAGKKNRRLNNQNSFSAIASFPLSVTTVNATTVPPSVFHQHPPAQPENKEKQSCNIRS